MVKSYWIHFQEQHSTKNDMELETGKSQFVSTGRKNDPLAHLSWIPVPCCPKVPLEPLLKIILPGLGIFAEGFLNVKHGKLLFQMYEVNFFDECGFFSGMGRLHHITLYLGFLVSGIVDLLSLYCNLPKSTSQLFLSLAVYNQVLLFYYHIHGRNLFNITIHKLLAMCIVVTAVFVTLRMLNPRNLLINTGIAAGMILQGTHLIQAGSLIYGAAKFHPTSHSNEKFIVAVTTWHILGVNVFMIGVYLIVRALFTRMVPRRYFIDKFAGRNDGAQETELLIKTNTVTETDGCIIEMQPLATIK